MRRRRRKRLQQKFIDFALRDDYLISLDDIPVSPHRALSTATQELRRLNRRLIPRHEWKNVRRTRLSTLTIQLPWCTFLSRDWAEYSVPERARILIHEGTHARQQDDRKLRFWLKYMLAGWRWGLEMQAYRQDLRAFRRFGASKEDMEKSIDSIAGFIRDTYALKRYDSKDVRERTIEVLSRELP